MASAVYIAVVERTKNGYSVFFPDVPGCVSAGREPREVYENSEQALAAHLHLLAQEGEEIPQASREVEVDPDVEEVARLLVRVDLPGKAVRLNITMDEGLVASIDRVSKNRSGFLADAAREELARRRSLTDA